MIQTIECSCCGARLYVEANGVKFHGVPKHYTHTWGRATVVCRGSNE